MNRKLRMRSTAIALAVLALIQVSPVQSAEWTCQLASPVTGGMLHLVITGTDATPVAVQGAVELSTRNVGPPLGFRDGTYPWDVDQDAIRGNGAILGLNFDITLPLSAPPNWGFAAGSLVPTQLNFLLPNLRNPTGAPIQLGGITLISGNGRYNSNNEWHIRTGDGAILVSNTPDPLSLMYSRELLQIISNDPNEPITLFLTPAIPGPVDSIVSFHAGGIIEAPGRTDQMIREFVASNGNCPNGATAIPQGTGG